MKASRRRRRRTDRLASPAAVRHLLGQLRETLPEIIPPAEKELVRMLRAARHVERYPATETKRGRPPRFARSDLIKVAARLSEILGRETSSHISVASFVDHYLRLLDFPADLIDALARGDVNLFEAEQLARVTPAKINARPARAKRLRLELLSTQLQTKASGRGLRQRVDELFRGARAGAPPEEPAAKEFENLEDFDPYDPAHLFWEQIKQLGFAFREIGRADVTDEEVEELLRVSDPVLSLLGRIRRRRAQNERPGRGKLLL